MSAAARALHLAIEDAVGELEPQLLTLRPTQRTHLAMKMLVALTRFFPEQHRVRRAGEQLELIWPPLVDAPRGAAAGKLLHYYFRLRQDLFATPDAALRRSMLDLVRLAIDEAQHGGNEAAATACDGRLRLLAGFLPRGSVDMSRLDTLSPLARLFLWQQVLEGPAEAAADRDAVNPLLLPDLLAVLDRCMALCRASDWSLEYFCNSGLGPCLWQLRGMARFGNNHSMAELLDELDDECLDMHLAGDAPPAGSLQHWLVRLLAVVQERNHPRPPPPHTTNAPELALRAIYDQELANYRRQLQAELEGASGAGAASTAGPQPAPLRVTAPLITLLYKLTWVFAAAEQPDWARLCHCAYRVALQHWRVRRPLGPASEAMLCNVASMPGSFVPRSTLRHWRWQLLQDWPNWARDSRRPIALLPEGAAVVALEAVPDLLSGSFTALVQAGRPTELPSATACQPSFQVLVHDMASELLQELALLEKGAAAMKVWPLEQLCTLLIAVYETHLRDAVEFGASFVPVLQNAHRHLVRMLDEAAAWREATTHPALVQSLESWLRESLAQRSACREPRGTQFLPDAAGDTQAGTGSTCEQDLRAQLLTCLGTLASVLERPVRLQLDVGKVGLDPGRLMQVVDCLRPLIKFMLLDQSVDARTRQAMHKPRISTLAVTLRATSAVLSVTVGEDSHEEVLNAAELQRLQRRLPKCAGPLACESRAGRGRAFTFTLA